MIKQILRNLAILILLVVTDFNIASAYTTTITSNGKTIYLTGMTSYGGGYTEFRVTYKNFPSDGVNRYDYSGDLIIPANITYQGKTYPITGTDAYAFKNCVNLKSVTFKNYALIDRYSFVGCSNLTGIYGNSMFYVLSYAFDGCDKLQTFPFGLLSATFENYAFRNCKSLKEAKFPSSTSSTTFPKGFFSGCSSLKVVSLPKNIKVIDGNAFSNCSSLEEISISASVERIEDGAFIGCSNLKTISIEDSQKSLYIGRKSYNQGQFYDCKLDSIYIGRNIDFSTTQSDGFSPFAQNSTLNIVVFGKDVRNINASLFYSCRNLYSIAFNNDLESIKEKAFKNCQSLKQIRLPKSITSIGEFAFDETSIENVFVENTVPINISDNVFSSETYSNNLYVPVSSVESYFTAEGWKNFRKIESYNSSDFEVDGIFYTILNLSDLTCGVTAKNFFGDNYDADEITIPSTVIYQNRVFKVTHILPFAFNNSSLVNKVILPSSIVEIGKSSFDDCKKLRYLEIPNTIVNMNANIEKLPLEKVRIFGAGVNIPDWFKFNTSISSVEIDCPIVTDITNNAFNGCHTLTTLSLPATITSIGNHAFNNCYKLSDIDLPKGLLELGSAAFMNCVSLESISFNCHLAQICDSTFANCSSLRMVDIGDNISAIGKGAFMNCSALEHLTISSSINSIGDNTFLGCSKINTINIEDSNIPIQLGNNWDGNVASGIFSSCPIINLYIGRDIEGESPLNFNKSNEIETIVIGPYVKSFPKLDLGNSPKLKTLKLGKSLTSIPSFNTCTNLEFLEIGAHLSTIPSFSNCASLRTIRTHSAMPQSVDADFANKVYTDCSLEVPKGTIETYRSAPIWKNFFNLSEFAPEAIATKLEIVPSAVSLYTNETLQLNTDIYPLNANEVFNWESSNKDVVIVDTYGKITAVKDGEAIITAKTVDGSNLSAQCKVTVKPVIYVSELIPEKDYIALTVGTDSTLSVSINPSDATYKDLIWTSSNSNIATVTNCGVVSAVNIGKSTIKVEATDGSSVSTYILVDALPVYVKSIEIQTDTTSLPQDEQCQLTVKITPEDASIKNIIWEASDTTLMNVSETGLLTGLKPGIGLVYAYATDGSNIFASKEIEVLPLVSSSITAQLSQNGEIDLHWAAKDYVKNVKDYNVYVSEDDGDFVLWLHNTTNTSAKFRGIEGRSYRFTVTMRNSNLVNENYDETKIAYIYVTK